LFQIKVKRCKPGGLYDSLISTELSRNPWSNKISNLPINNLHNYNLEMSKNIEKAVDTNTHKIDTNFNDIKLHEIVVSDIEINTQIDNMV
jgi:hypothetical protein